MANGKRDSAPISLRLLTQADPIREVETLQREVWGFDDIEVVPLHVLLTAARHGGILLGAYADERMVGFSFGYRGLDLDGTPVLCSHLLAVAPHLRGQGVGAALKWAQRDAALTSGLTRIVWTFDPLEHGNARLNLDRLGGVSNRYLVDLYGELRDELNAGLPTDRIEIVWDLASARVERRAPTTGLGDEAVTADLGPLLDADGPDPAAPDVEGPSLAWPDAHQTPRIRVRALAEAQRLRTEAPATARAWRWHLRRTLGGAFDAGYVLVGAGEGPAGPEYRLATGSTIDGTPTGAG